MNRSICMLHRHMFAAFATALAAFGLYFGSAQAQTYPERVIRVVVPWPAGGTGDVATRVITQHLAGRFSQPVIIENRPGANGLVGADAVAKSAPDGHTLLLASVETHALNPHVYPKLPYDPLGDFVAVTPFVKVPSALAGRVGLGAASTKEAVALIQAQPSKLTYGTWGIGSLGHVGMEMLVGQAGLKILHVPYNGGPPAFNALMAGQIDLMILPAGTATPLKNGGKIKVFGVTTRNRFPLMEDIPTLKEQGYDLDASNTYGFVVPAKTPLPIVQKLHAEINDLLKQPNVRAALQALGLEVFTLSQQEYARYLQTELSRWGDVIRRADIKMDK